MAEKISIIVPVYNGEKFIKRCLDSLLLQTYSNMEISIVDDGSTDHTMEICREYAEKDGRIVFYHIVNSGVSAARNLGLQYSTGEIIGFVDSDDYVSCGMYGKMVSIMNKHDADIVVCRFAVVRDSQHQFQCNDESMIIFDTDQFQKEVVENRNVGGYLWNKIFRKSILKGSRLNTRLSILEDMDFIFSIMHNVGRAVYMDEELYGYYISSENTTQRPDTLFDKSLNLKYALSYDYMIEKYFSNNGRMKNAILNNKTAAYYQLAHKAIANGWEDKYREALVEYLKVHKWDAIFRSRIPFKIKCHILLICRPDLYKTLLKTKNAVKYIAKEIK